MTTYKCEDCSHEIISDSCPTECEICYSSRLKSLEHFKASKQLAATTTHVKVTSTTKIDEKSQPVKASSTKRASSVSIGCFKSLVAVLLGGLIPSWNLLAITVFVVPKSAATVVFFLFFGSMISGMIWGYRALRKRSWGCILSFGGLGVLIYFAIVIVLSLLDFIE